jgi:hypothetical protein
LKLLQISSWINTKSTGTISVRKDLFLFFLTCYWEDLTKVGI